MAGARGPHEWSRAVEVACAAPLQFRPGTRYAYCNPTFFVMGDLVQRLSGRDHVDWLQETVLDPLGMRDTTFVPPDSARVVPVLDPPWPDERGRATWISLRNPAGGLWSTAQDLVRFGQTLLHDGSFEDYQLLSPATLRAMTSLQTAGIPAVTGAGHFQVLVRPGLLQVRPRRRERTISRAPLASRFRPRRRHRHLPVDRARIRSRLRLPDQPLAPGRHVFEARLERCDSGFQCDVMT